MWLTAIFIYLYDAKIAVKEGLTDILSQLNSLFSTVKMAKSCHLKLFEFVKRFD